jgi:hypothetical protein
MAAPYLWGPAARFFQAGSTTITPITLNAAGVGIGGISRVRYAPGGGVTINQVDLYVPTRTGTPPAYNVGVVTVDASGMPTTTPYGGSAIESWTPLATGSHQITLTTPATPTLGDLIACVVYDGATPPDSSNFIAAYSAVKFGDSSASNFPYVTTRAAATWAKVGDHPVIVPRYSNGSYAPFLPAIGAVSPVSTTTFNSGSSPNRYGAKFQVPFEGACRGALVPVDVSALSNAFDVALYDASLVEMARTSITASQFGTVTNGVFEAWWSTGPETLSPTLDYFLFVEPQTADNLRVAQWVAPNADAKAAVPCGDLWQLSTRTGTGATTETANTVPLLGLIFDSMTTDPTVNVTTVNVTTVNPLFAVFA